MENINKVMIIDDNATFIFPLEMVLKKKGIDVISFTNPEEAIEYLKNNKIHVLLTDYHMEPAINGDEVIRRIREFDKDIIIYLQTGYAETLPADEMLEKYEIQGYIDKGEGQEKNVPLIIASLKQARLIEEVKQTRKKLDAQSYKNEFLGRFLNRLMGEIGERTMAMVGAISHLEDMKDDIPADKKELHNNSVENIKKSSTKLNELIKSLDINENMPVSVGELERKIRNLFEIIFAVKYINLNFDYENEYQMFNCNQYTILFILVEIIDFLISKDEKTINISIKDEDGVVVYIDNNIEDINIVEKTNKLASLDENVNVNYTDSKISIIVK